MAEDYQRYDEKEMGLWGGGSVSITVETVMKHQISLINDNSAVAILLLLIFCLYCVVRAVVTSYYLQNLYYYFYYLSKHPVAESLRRPSPGQFRASESWMELRSPLIGPWHSCRCYAVCSVFKSSFTE